MTRLRVGSNLLWLVPGVVGGSEEYTVRVLESILQNGEHPARDAILLNAAASLVVALGLEPKAATARARAALESGAAYESLLRLKRAANPRRPAQTG